VHDDALDSASTQRLPARTTVLKVFNKLDLAQVQLAFSESVCTVQLKQEKDMKH
jgi:hypothetical protein|tara:strand:+ start:2589 stop:2750 length:162 start_codon:yes stop_codon:yes gene_type:complete